jgi:hypothetical protein
MPYIYVKPHICKHDFDNDNILYYIGQITNSSDDFCGAAKWAGTFSAALFQAECDIAAITQRRTGSRVRPCRFLLSLFWLRQPGLIFNRRPHLTPIFFQMHSASFDTDISGKDGGEVLVAIAALVTEGRIPGKLSSKTKGFYEGPHCPLNKAAKEHKCDLTDLLVRL